MTRYRRIETGTLTDQKVAELSRPQPNGQTLWMYLITGKRTTPFPGLVVAKEVEIAADLGWPIVADLFTPMPGNGCRCLRDAWGELETRGMVVPDWISGVIVLPRALLDRRGEARLSAKPTSPNDFRGWVKWWDEIPDCDLKAWYLAELGRFAGALDRATERSKKPDAYLAAYREAFATPLTRVAEAHPDAYATRHPQKRDIESSRSVNASETRRRPTRDPVPVPEVVVGPDLSTGSSQPSGDPDSGGSREHDQGRPSPVDRGGARAAGSVVPSVRVEPPRSAALGPPPLPRPESGNAHTHEHAAPSVAIGGLWARQAAWWEAMRATHRKLRDEGIDPNAPDLPSSFGTGIHDKNLRLCWRGLIDSGYSEAEAEAKFHHVITLRAAEARRDRSLRWFKPMTMFDPENFARACDMTIDEIKPPPDSPSPPPGPATGRINPSAMTHAPTGRVDLRATRKP
jgi:hypothetical protein